MPVKDPLSEGQSQNKHLTIYFQWRAEPMWEKRAHHRVSNRARVQGVIVCKGFSRVL